MKSKSKNPHHPTSDQQSSLELTARSTEQLGQALERFRRRQDLTQAVLGKKAGLRQGTISKIEKGVSTTELGTLFALCSELNLELVLRDRNSNRSLKIEDVFS